MLPFIKHLKLHIACSKNTITSTYILSVLTASSISARTQFILVPDGDINCLNVLLSKPQLVFTLHDIWVNIAVVPAVCRHKFLYGDRRKDYL
jgi:hypothetical protein